MGCGTGGGDMVDRSAFWEICEAHAKLDAETTVFSDTSAGLIVNAFPEVKTDSIGHEKLTLTSNTISSEQAIVFPYSIKFATPYVMHEVYTDSIMAEYNS